MTKPAAKASPRRIWRIVPVLIFALALVLRTIGLSHDLHLGNIYHPDTPKQMRAAERFLQGEYYFFTDHPDYDGYPLFNSHLVEYAWRLSAAARSAAARFAGFAPQPSSPDTITLYWVARAINALLSALSVLVVYWIGSDFLGRREALLASFFLAVSPLDIAACHFETADSTTAFFAVLAVLFALRMSRGNRTADYILGGLFAAAAFSAKYHGGMALSPLLCAHAAGHWPLKRTFSAKSAARLGLLGLAFVGGVFVTSPALLVSTREALGQMLDFMRFTSKFNMTPEMLAMSWPARSALAMRINLPPLFDAIGPVVCLASVAALFIHRKNPVVWILVSMPAAYIVVGLSAKPVSCHATYHALVTPLIFLLGGVALVRLLDAKRLRPGLIGLFLVLSGSAAWHLSNYSRHELFFFRHNDTRRVAESWVIENVPTSMPVRTGRYTFEPVPRKRGDEFPGSLHVAAGVDERSQEHVFLMNTFDVETSRLTIFRNMPIRVYMEPSRDIRADFASPFPQYCIASPRNDNLVFADAPCFYRSPKIFDVDARGEREREAVVASPSAMRKALLALQGGPDQSSVDVEFGGHRYRVCLDVNETKMIEAADPRSLFLPRNPNRFYPFKARAAEGKARIVLATNDREAAWLLHNAGHHEKAFERFSSIPGARGTAMDQTARLISGILCGRISTEDARAVMAAEPGMFETPLAEDRFFSQTGVSTKYLAGLPYLSFTQAFHPDGSSDSDPAETLLYNEPCRQEDFDRKPTTFIAIGCYRLALSAENRKSDWTVEVTDHLDRRICGAAWNLDPSAAGRRESFVLPFEAGRNQSIRVRIVHDPDDTFVLREALIEPDPLATANGRISLLKMLVSDEIDENAAGPAVYDSLVSRGDTLCRNGEQGKALAWYEAAVRAAPYRGTAYERFSKLDASIQNESPELSKQAEDYATLRDASQFHPVGALFANGIKLAGFQQGCDRVRAGGSAPLNLFWEAPDRAARPSFVAVWVHFLKDGSQEPVFQGDHWLSVDRSAPRDDELRPRFYEIKVPEDVEPGLYRVKIGLWIFGQRKSILVRSADLPHDEKGIYLTSITVE